MITGTSYFVTKNAAIRYYKGYGYADTVKTVERKIREGEIHIGKPPYKPGVERLVLLDGGKRYGIEETKARNPHTVIPSKFTAAKVRQVRGRIQILLP